MTAHEILRFGPLLLLVFTAIHLLFATRRTSREIGCPAYGFGQTRRQRFTHFLFRVGILGGFVAAMAFAVGVSMPGLQSWSDNVRGQSVGLLIAICGLCLILLAQFEMGEQWRIGVPADAPNKLVTTGLFRHSRNPVFVGMLAVAIGLSIGIASHLAIAAAVFFWVACELQVRDEERTLEAAFGETYQAYRRRVPRWIGCNTLVTLGART